MDSIGKRYNSGKSVPGQMSDQILFDATKVSDFLKIGIGLLVAQNRQHTITIDTFGVVRIAFKDLRIV
ncbi:hypothetical protein [Flagellimonas sp.]|uniref:hypothetical protein n=1 Tax=Flagellimonas sp. TaxID=2058762 RepID=UPI003BB0BE64